MNYFLAKQRRNKLIEGLLKLTMPHNMATKMASLPNDWGIVDRIMVDHVRQIMQHAEDIAKADVNDLALIRQLGTFLHADLLLVEAVKAEATERGLSPNIGFPRWLEAAANRKLQ
jgi:hypothetical protein